MSFSLRFLMTAGACALSPDQCHSESTCSTTINKASVVSDSLLRLSFSKKCDRPIKEVSATTIKTLNAEEVQVITTAIGNQETNLKWCKATHVDASQLFQLASEDPLVPPNTQKLFFFLSEHVNLFPHAIADLAPVIFPNSLSVDPDNSSPRKLDLKLYREAFKGFRVPSDPSHASPVLLKPSVHSSYMRYLEESAPRILSSYESLLNGSIPTSESNNTGVQITDTKLDFSLLSYAVSFIHLGSTFQQVGMLNDPNYYQQPVAPSSLKVESNSKGSGGKRNKKIKELPKKDQLLYNRFQISEELERKKVLLDIILNDLKSLTLNDSDIDRQYMIGMGFILLSAECFFRIKTIDSIIDNTKETYFSSSNNPLQEFYNEHSTIIDAFLTLRNNTFGKDGLRYSPDISQKGSDVDNLFEKLCPKVSKKINLLLDELSSHLRKP